MKEQIAGNNYDYIIEIEDGEGEYNFEIKSLYKVGGSKSGIVNLNFIISELIKPILKIIPEDRSFGEWEAEFEFA